MRTTLKSIFFLLLSISLYSQDDPVLLHIDGNPIKLSEFTYIYEKNNGKDADYSKESVEEYLNLFTNFKLKVYKARQFGMDTITVLNEELAGYRKQLATSYLMEKELSERLIKEMYDRRSQDVKISHILFKLRRNPSEEEVNTAIQKATAVRNRIMSGTDFTKAAASESEDEGTASKGGTIGYVTSWLPSGFYNLENAAYNLEIGEMSQPIVTKLGVHIVKVEDKRPAYGKMEVAHILIRKDNPTNSNPKMKAQKIHLNLEQGQPFDLMAQTLSDDKSSAKNGGKLQPFGINTFENAFEEAAFALKNDGDISRPVETRIGWHVIKRINKPTESYEEFKARMKPELPKLDRYNTIQEILIEETKRDYNFTFSEEALQALQAATGEDFFTYMWQAPSDLKDRQLMAFGNEGSYMLSDFAAFAKKNSRSRMKYNKEKSKDEAIFLIFKEYVKDVAMQLQEKNLENKYPDFKALMREYEEGILLFEVSKLMIWDKASKDTTGLNAFFKKNKGNYKHEPEAIISNYNIARREGGQAQDILAYARNHNADDVLYKFNEKRTVVSVTKEEVLADDNRLSNVEWKNGSTSGLTLNTEDGTTVFLKIEKIIPQKQKSLSESRGYVIADYQQNLEKKWTNNLRKEFKVKINQNILDNIITN